MEAATKVLVGGDCEVVPVGVICAMRMVESWYVTVERLARSKRAGRRRSRSRCRSLRVLPYLAKVCDSLRQILSSPSSRRWDGYPLSRIAVVEAQSFGRKNTGHLNGIVA